VFYASHDPCLMMMPTLLSLQTRAGRKQMTDLPVRHGMGYEEDRKRRWLPPRASPSPSGAWPRVRDLIFPFCRQNSLIPFCRPPGLAALPTAIWRSITVLGHSTVNSRCAAASAGSIFGGDRARHGREPRNG